MAPGSTADKPDNLTRQLKIGLYNAENLFLLFDHEIPPHYQKLNEAQWQKLSASVYENKPLHKCLQIGQLLTENKPDIMMLCEVGGAESLKNFNTLFLNDAYHPVLIEGNSDRNIDVGFLILKDSRFRFEISSHKTRPLNFLYPHETTSKNTGYGIRHPSHLFSRDCAELRLYAHGQSLPFLIILLTHLKSRLDPERIDPGGTERRSAELRTAVSIYNETRAQFPDIPVILAGDMNGYAGRLNTDAEFMPLYNTTDLEDILEVAGVTTEKRSTFYQIKSGGKSEGKQIDYCFLSKNLVPNLIPSSAHVYRYKDEFGFAMDQPKTLDDKMLLPSDHYPLFFSLENLIF